MEDCVGGYLTFLSQPVEREGQQWSVAVAGPLEGHGWLGGLGQLVEWAEGLLVAWAVALEEAVYHQEGLDPPW